MADFMNINEALEQMSKEQLIELAKEYARLPITIDGFWFLETEKRLGREETIRIDTNAWRGYGQAEARKLKRIMSIDGDATPEQMLRTFALSPAWHSLRGQADIVDGKLKLSVTYCHAQEARRKRGPDAHACKPVDTAYFEAFVEEMNPRGRIRCLFAPPDPQQDGCWRQWELWVE